MNDESEIETLAEHAYDAYMRQIWGSPPGICWHLSSPKVRHAFREIVISILDHRSTIPCPPPEGM